MHGLNVQADYAILVKLEAAMKRPEQGLLKRMMRLTEVDYQDMVVDGGMRRVLSLKLGTEYHVALQILRSPSSGGCTVCAADWLSISMPGCLPLHFQVGNYLQHYGGQGYSSAVALLPIYACAKSSLVYCNGTAGC